MSGYYPSLMLLLFMAIFTLKHAEIFNLSGLLYFIPINWFVSLSIEYLTYYVIHTYADLNSQQREKEVVHRKLGK